MFEDTYLCEEVQQWDKVVGRASQATHKLMNNVANVFKSKFGGEFLGAYFIIMPHHITS